MAGVDYVESSPLTGGDRAQDLVGGEGYLSKVLFALDELCIHGLKGLGITGCESKAVDDFGWRGGRNDWLGGFYAVGKISEPEQGYLGDALFEVGLGVGGPGFLETFGECFA